MIRVKRGNIAKKHRKKYLKLAKGYVGTASKLSSLASEQVIQSLNYAYIGRRLRKRDFRKIWISRINACTRYINLNYSSFIGLLIKANIFLNRKMLAFLAYTDLTTFHLLQRQLLKN